MSALNKVQAGALLAVSDVIVDYATELYVDPYGSDQREYERDCHLREHLLKLATDMRDKAHSLQLTASLEIRRG